MTLHLKQYILVLLTLCLVPVLATPNGHNSRPKFNWARIKYIYAFGDSYTFVGGTQGYPRFR